NLLLGRSLAREREFAIRAALGSGPSRVVRQVLTEGLLLAAAGTVLGVLLAIAAVHYFWARAPVDLPPGTVIAVDGYVLMFAVVLAVATTVLFGLVPAWRASRSDVYMVLKTPGSTAALRPLRTTTGRTLIAVEVACAMLLLVGAGLLNESIVRLGAAPLGF